MNPWLGSVEVLLKTWRPFLDEGDDGRAELFAPQNMMIERRHTSGDIM